MAVRAGSTAETLKPEQGPVGVRHALCVYACPRALFGRIEDTGAYGWTLATLLFLAFLVGYAEVQTGLVDRDVDQRTEVALAALESAQGDLVDRVELGERMEGVRKSGEFAKLMARLGAVVLTPVYVLASCLLISSALYAVVALGGRKPEYHTLMSVCVYASFIELAGLVVRLAMMVYYRTTAVNTSLGMLAPEGVASPLAAIDVFRVWFWILVVLGVVQTRQLSRRAAVVSGVLMAVAATGARAAILAKA